MTSDTAGYWDAEASTFDEAPDHGLLDPVVRAAWRALLVPSLPPAPARVADLGCGTGTLSLLLAEAGYQVSGTDLSPRMIEAARAKLARFGDEAAFVVGDAAHPSWPAGTFDVVLSRHVLWALPDRESVLARWLKLLAPGGVLVLVEGRWWNGEGLPLSVTSALVRSRRVDVDVTVLSDPALWGGPITDERYLLVSRS